MGSRKELDLNEFPSDDEQHELSLQEEKFTPTEKMVEVDLNEIFTGMDYADVTPTKVENARNQFAQTQCNSDSPHQAYQTLTDVEAILEAGASNPKEETGFPRTVSPKPKEVDDDIRRGLSSKDPEPKLKSTTTITPKLEHPQESSNTIPKGQQMFYAKQLQQQQLDSQPFPPKQVYALPFHLQQQSYEWLIQQKQLDAQSFHQKQLDAGSFHQQQLNARSFHQQQLDARSFQLQQLYAQPFQLQQQHPSGSMVKAESAGSSDHRVENIMPIEGIEHPLSTGTTSIPCRPQCPYLHDMSARLENHDVFEYSNKKNKSKKKKKRDQGDCSFPERQDSTMHIEESSGVEYFTPLTLKTLEEIRMRVKEKIK